MYVDEVKAVDKAQRNFKDTVFRMLFKDKKELLALYNAINNTNYTNPDDLEITTLENAIYMSMKNDVSFVIEMTLNLYEHQATVNPNLPLRDLGYVSKTFSKYIRNKDIYSPKLIRLPNPRFIVFYNGKEKQPSYRKLNLSDAYLNKEEEPSLELIVTQININPGYNDNLMDKCPTLKGYMIYVDKIREFQKTMSLEEAVNKAVNYCISNGILADFLIENKSEVVNMSIFEYDEQLHEETMKEIGREEGFQQGIKETLDMSIKATISMLRELKCSDEQIVEQLVTKLNIDVEVAEEYVYGKK